jgi:hypothetical protein
MCSQSSSNPEATDARWVEQEVRVNEDQEISNLTRTSQTSYRGSLPQAEHKELGAVCARNLRTQQRAKSQCQIMHNPVLGGRLGAIRVRIPLID